MSATPADIRTADQSARQDWIDRVERATTRADKSKGTRLVKLGDRYWGVWIDGKRWGSVEWTDCRVGLSRPGWICAWLGPDGTYRGAYGQADPMRTRREAVAEVKIRTAAHRRWL